MSNGVARDERGRVRDPHSAHLLGKRGGRPPKVESPVLERTASHSADVMAGYGLIEARLVAAGFPATSPWWQDTFLRWYTDEKRQLVARVGRRGGKSSSFSRLAVAEALFGHHDVPPGDTGWVAIISADRTEALGRLRTIQAILDALGVKWVPAPKMPHAIELDGRPIGFRVFTASITGVSGFTGVFVLCDEVAKWRDADTGTNPATIVLQSVRPTLSTQKHSRIVLSSSPMGRWDAHYDAFESGETGFQTVAYAPSWEANPTLDEEYTHTLEADETAWLREYKALPADEMLESIFTGAELDAVTRPAPAVMVPEEGYTYVAAIDPATRGNAWTLVVATMLETPTGPVRSVVLSREWRGTRSRPLSPRDTLAAVAAELKPYKVDTVWSDQASGDAMRELADDVGLTLVVDPWNLANKLEAFNNLVTWVRTRQMELPPDTQVRQDLLGVRRKYSRNGVSIDFVSTPDGRHSDYAPAAAMALSRALDKPRKPEPKLGTAEWEKREEQKRIDEYLESQKPLHQRTNLHDRGANAHWRPALLSADRRAMADWKRGRR